MLLSQFVCIDSYFDLLFSEFDYELTTNNTLPFSVSQANSQSGIHADLISLL
jgi:hypothetical protein